MSDVLISIIINSHNGEKFIEKSIKSVLSQTYKNFEIIFWDNASTDNTKQKLENFNDDRLKVHYSKKFEKLYSAKEKAIKLCKGDYLAFLDVDDWWEKNKLEIQINHMKKNNALFSCSNYWIMNEKKNKKFSAIKSFSTKNYFDYALKKYFVGMSTLIVSKKLYESLDYGFDNSFEIIGDYDLVLRLLKKEDILYLNEKLSYYRWHSENLSNKKFRLNILELIRWKKKMEKNQFFFNKQNKLYLNDHIIFLLTLYLKNKNYKYKIFNSLFRVNSIKYFLKIFLLFIFPKNLINFLRS